MAYEQIRRRKIYEEIADQLLDRIKSGELSPGEKLDSVHLLAEQFNVGRSAVREALSALRAMGLIEMKQGEGTYVKQFDPSSISQSLSVNGMLMKKEDIVELLEVRKVIETGCAASAAAKRTDQDLMNMQEALNEMEKAALNHELGEQADLKFHMAITSASHNNILLELMNHVSQLMYDSIRETRKISFYSETTMLEKLFDEHRRIFLAIKSQNASEAQHAMLDHLNTVESVLLKYA
ncbi:FadR/GntR family transcriptional regulator [Alkalihalobacillus sp. CinArs1]|uniref:FadR/GntR family transcriptional regulator n=1 Tax=Alkalihalobacillus sp. CinArs1 TaxID=2995314 RepID=UPI0022DD8D0D|nr:FadR/GntR family transcriptional regulator [Alkalihalobacillus sp. CinArs1]